MSRFWIIQPKILKNTGHAAIDLERWIKSKVSPRKYVFDVTSVGQLSSPWPCNSVKV